MFLLGLLFRLRAVTSDKNNTSQPKGSEVFLGYLMRAVSCRFYV